MMNVKMTAAAAILAVGTLGAADVTPAKAAGLGEVLVTGIGIAVGAGAVAWLTGGAAYGPMLMSAMGVETAAATGAATGAMAGAEAGAMAGGAAAGSGHIGALAAHGLHVTWHAVRAGAVILGGLTGGYITNNLFYGW